LNITISALAYNFGLRSRLPKITFRTKTDGVWVRGASKKNWDPLFISATIEARNFKFGTQLGFEE